MRYLLVFAIASLTAAQILVPQAASSTFPGCALSCSPLLAAQGGCVPPAAPVTDQATYVSCFCQSALLTTLHTTTPGGPCDPWCTVQSDQQELMQWYNNFCNSGGAGAVPATTSSGSTQTTLVTSTVSAGSTASTTSTSPSSGSSSTSNKSWIGSHWQWILMVAILVVGFGALAFLAVWLKKRHRRKADEKRATRSGFPIEREKAGSRASIGNLEDLFGPAQHMAATKGWEYPTESDRSLGAGSTLAGERKRSHRKPRRHHSSRSRDQDLVGVDEIGSEETHEGRGQIERGSRSQRRREHELEREKNKEIESRLRGFKGKNVARDKGAEKS